MVTLSALSRRLASGVGAITSKPTLGSPSILAAGALLLAYVALEWMSFIHEYGGLPVTPWNPGLGVAFGMIVLKGAAYSLVLFAGVVIAEILVLQTGLAWPVILAIAAVVAAGYAAAGRLARKYLRLDVRLNHVRDVLVLLGAGGAGAAVVAMLLGALLLTDKELGADIVARSVIPLFVGDVIGIAVVTPLLLRFMRWQWPSRAALPALAMEVLVFALATGLALWMIVGSDRPHDYKYFSLLFLPVVGIGMRHGIDGACLALAATQLGLIAMLNVYGYDAATFTEFQVVMFVLTTTGLLVGAVVSERQHADLAAREAEERLKESQIAGKSRCTHDAGGRHGIGAGPRDQSADDGCARACPLGPAYPRLAQRRSGARRDQPDSLVVAQIDHAGGVVRRMREFLRRGQPRFSTLDVERDARRCAGAGAAGGRRTPNPHRSRHCRSPAAGLRRPHPAAAGRAQSSCATPWTRSPTQSRRRAH